MNLFERLFFDHRFDEWASAHSLLAARVLNQAAADLILQAEDDLRDAKWKDGLIDSSGFLNRKIAARVREVAEPLARIIVEEANSALRTIADEKAMWSRSVEAAPMKNRSFESAGDIAAAVLPLGAGTAVAVALPYAAITTGSAYFGLVTTSVISWPVLIGGSALAGLGLATGVLEGSKLWAKVERRLRDKTRGFIIAALLKGSPDHPSILEQLEAEFWCTAERARAR